MNKLLISCCFLSLITACAAFPNCQQMGQLRIGMIEEEVLKIMDRQPDKFSATGYTKHLYYSCRGAMPDSDIKFIGGKLVSYGPENDHNKSRQVYLFKLGVTDAEFKRDTYECSQQSQQSWSGGGTGILGLIMIQQAHSEAEEKANRIYMMCMEARGYKQEN